MTNLHDEITDLDRKPLSAGRHDAHCETDRQMLLKAGRRFALLFIAVSWFGEILDWMTELSHVAIELLDLGVEAIEHFSEEILEYFLHTNHHQSEIIIVNTVLVLMAFGLYRLYRAAPGLYRRWKRNRRASWLRYKRRKVFYWRSLSQAQKVKLAAAYITGTVLLASWLTL
ncbi:MAG: hypothetical protein ACU837_06630 [Gammaproteobacteria bacterium]